MRLIERVWEGDTTAHRVSRGALAPLEAIYRSATAVRGILFDRGLIEVARSPIGVVSVGNVTVGGTGKTPVSAWIASRLSDFGRQPMVVLRGYGDDEPLVHARTNPGIGVIVDRNRARGIAKAFAAGADSAVLDDGFQHRGAQRDVDVVLVSADQWTRAPRVLPAGPYREPPSAIQRASIVIVTAKAVSTERIAEVTEWVGSVAPDKPLTVIGLRHSHLVREVPRDGRAPLATLNGKRVLAIAAVGNPAAFLRQLEASGAIVTPLIFGDHHAFSSDDVRKAIALTRNVDLVVCTLKDAVKLAPIWPATEVPLWYVSLSVIVESGGSALDDMLRRLPRRRG